MITKETSGDLTIFRVTGDVTANDILKEAVQYVEGVQTKTSMWDFTQAAKVDISTLELKGIADSLKNLTEGGTNRKVALVGSKNINIGLGKVFGAFAQMAGLHYNYRTFRDRNDALKWLEA